MNTNIVEIYYIIDEFCKEIERTMEGHQLVKKTSNKTRKRAFLHFYNAFLLNNRTMVVHFFNKKTGRLWVKPAMTGF